MSIIPFSINKTSNILVAGAGGGFDFICGLPIILQLEESGNNVHIANYSFTDLGNIRNARWHSDYLLEISAESYLENGDYFPELYLSKWYKENTKIDKKIWCFSRYGVKPILKNYNYIIEKYNIDTVFCIDGGVDGIFRGDEFDLGTPSMDSISVIASSLSSAVYKYYVCTAFGIEGAEGKVSHAQVLNRISDLIKMNSFSGIGAIIKTDPIGNKFYNIIKSIYIKLPQIKQSIIVNSILASMDGIFGRNSIHPKTEINPPWISPLTSLFWYFNADSVAKIKLFYNDVLDTETVEEVSEAISIIRDKKGIKDYENIPI
ncbi:MAG: DUF1152 domain-containing protein [Spirochaetales bacterium]|nr:DUF1152 domain-containing protein [Spirochaetales bacterium]